MRRFIVGLVVGVVLTATATAAAGYGFKPMNKDVECRTTSQSVVCGLRTYQGDGDYTVYVSGCSAAVWRHSETAKDGLVTVFDRHQPLCR